MWIVCKITAIKDFYSLPQEQQDTFFNSSNLILLCKEEHKKLHKALGNTINKDDSINYINTRRIVLGTDYLFNSKCG